MKIVAKRKNVMQRVHLFVAVAVLTTSSLYGVWTTNNANAAINRNAVAMHGKIIDTYDNQPIPLAEIEAGCGEGGNTLLQADATGSYSFTKGQLADFIDYECPFAMGLAMNAYESQYGYGDTEWENFDHDYEDWDLWIDTHFTGQYFDFHLTGDGSQDKAVPTGFTNVSSKTVAEGTMLAITDLQVTGEGNETLDLTLKAAGGGTIDFTMVDGVTVTGRGTDYVMLAGARSDINDVLATMQYTAGSVGEVTITAELGNNVGDVLWNNGEGGNGHAYIVVSSSMTWHAAEAAAQTYKFGGQTGYLATITSAQENAFIYDNLPIANRTGWLGATDEAVEGTWRWQTGPEAGELLPYTNWSAGEPNNQSDEDCMQFVTGGQWNDISCGSTRRFVVEFGGATLPQPTRGQFTVDVVARAYVLSFNAQGGTMVAPIAGLGAGEEATIPGAPVRAGYIFKEWSLAADGEGASYNPGDNFSMLGEDVTLYAIWEEDGNLDEIPDGGQNNVVSLTDPATSKRVTLEVDESCTVATATMLRASDLTAKDSAYTYDNGFVNFTATGCNNGKTTVNLYYYGTSADSVAVRKHNPGKNSFFTINDAVLSRRTIAGQNITNVSYEVVDGGELDIDGLKNGAIVDPVGLGHLVVGVPRTGLGGTR